ncbi:MAG: hypothetical protein H7X97_01240 [Opitutaceae bacterium]|nr:hypothetical protein [Verrucomicrobiales bacterium]
MKKLKSEIDSRKKSSFASRSSRLVSGLLGSTAVAALLPLAGTGLQAAEPAAAEAAAPPPPPSRLNVLVNFEFSDKYLTPRGMIVQDEGVVFQPLILGFANVYKDDSFLNDVTLVGGFWNCFGSSGLPSSDSNGAKTTSWYEIDPIAGVSFTFAKNYKLDVTYTAFNMEVFNIPFSQHLETKFSFNDAPYLKKFALNPYVIYWQELSGKAVANTDPVPETSFYFDIGISPSYTIEKYSLKLEAPLRVLLPDSKFYGTGAGPSTTVGLYELGFKASMPLKFMPQGYGHWGAHIGFRYQDFVDPNLIATQGKSQVTQFYCGISTFF